MNFSWRIATGLLLAVGLAAAVRYWTFEASSFAAAMGDVRTPWDKSTVESLHELTDRSKTPEVVERLDVDGMKDTWESYAQRMLQLRSRYHEGETWCARYPTEMPKGDVDRAVEEISALGPAANLTLIVRAARDIESERDMLLHRLDEPSELLEYVSSHTGLWERAGARMHRSDILRAFTQLPTRAPEQVVPEKMRNSVVEILNRHEYMDIVSAVMVVAKSRRASPTQRREPPEELERQ
jgi:hypothetical protein